MTTSAEAGGKIEKQNTPCTKENDKNTNRKHSTGRRSVRQAEECVVLFAQLMQLNKACLGSVLALVLWPRCQIESPRLADM